VRLRIVNHRGAKRDALTIYVQIGEKNFSAGTRFLQSLNDDFKKLAEMPGMGAITEFADPKLAGLRSWPVSGFSNYLIFYRATATDLQIHRVLHGARDLERALLE
jgi:toxin ParE1/3/4